MKLKTRDQAATAQAKAVRFLENLVGDPERAADIESLSVDEYAERKGFTLKNPARSAKHMASRRSSYSDMSRAELIEGLNAAEARVAELEDFLVGAVDLLPEDEDSDLDDDED